jgi:hypothetical protein
VLVDVKAYCTVSRSVAVGSTELWQRYRHTVQLAGVQQLAVLSAGIGTDILYG